MFKYSLAFGNPEDGIRLEEYDAATLVEQMLDEHILLLTEKGYRVEYDTSRLELVEGMTIKTDAGHLMRIGDNIFSNLGKYADKSESIRISLSRSGNRIELTVINRIAHEKSNVESNGIGLKTCAKLAEVIAEGFEYVKGEDSFCVTLTLPVSLPKPEPKKATEPRSRARRAPKGAKRSES